MLEAMERIKPQLERLAEPSAPAVAETFPAQWRQNRPQPNCAAVAGASSGKKNISAAPAEQRVVKYRRAATSRANGLLCGHMQQAQKQKTENLDQSPIADPTPFMEHLRRSDTILRSRRDKIPRPLHRLRYCDPEPAQRGASQKITLDISRESPRWLEELNAQQRPGRAWILRSGMHIGLMFMWPSQPFLLCL